MRKSYLLIFKGKNKMSKTINIKGKEISEDTIVKALKKHCGFEEEELLVAGDFVCNRKDSVRIIVEQDCTNKLIAINLFGEFESNECNFKSSGYKKIGTLDRIFMQAGFNLK